MATRALAAGALAELLLEEGRVEDAEAALTENVNRCATGGFQRLCTIGHLALGRLRARRADGEQDDLRRARESFRVARDRADELKLPGISVVARCLLAVIDRDHLDDALAALAETNDRLESEQRMEAHLALWYSTRKRAHLDEARRQLDVVLSNVTEEVHEAMLTHVVLYREIMAAWCDSAE